MKITQLISRSSRWVLSKKHLVILGVIIIIAMMFIAVAIGKVYQNWDDDPLRGAKPISDGAFGENYSIPL